VFHSLKPFLCVACLLCLSIPGVQAAAWQEHKFAGFSAFDNGDYSGAVEQFEEALVIAYEEQAPAQDLGAILENLATAYFTVGRYQDARNSIERWDKILAESDDEPWTLEQQTVRDNLAPLISGPLGETEAPRDSEPTTVATTAPPPSGNYAIHLGSGKIKENVEPSWDQLKATYPSILTGKTLVVKQVNLGDQGTFYRILAVPFADSAGAEKVCRKFESLGQYCAVLPLE
jgi:tetratricopeptide (TPR) repeat protein